MPACIINSPERHREMVSPLQTAFHLYILQLPGFKTHAAGTEMEKGRAGITSKFLMTSPPFFYKETSGSPILRLESSHSCSDEDDSYECSEASIPQPPPLKGQLIHWLGNYLLVYNFKIVLLVHHTQLGEKRPIFQLNF